MRNHNACRAAGGRGKRRGFSLLEMAAASALIASILVPSLSVMRDAMATSLEVGRRTLLANYAVMVLEDYTAQTATNWTTTSGGGDFTADGYPNIRFTVTRSDNPVDGGLTNQLMHIEVTVFDDADADTVLDAGELRVDYRTKVAKLNSYENEEV